MHDSFNLASSVSLSGIGVHSAKPATVVISLNPHNDGLFFIINHSNKPKRIPARYPHCRGNFLCTCVFEDLTHNSEPCYKTVEHLLSALYGLRIYNAHIALNAKEMPILDGSAMPFVEALDKAERLPATQPKAIRITQPIRVENGDSYAALLPNDLFSLDITIDFPDSFIGRQNIKLDVNPISYQSEIAYARTFGFAEEGERLREQNLAQGASVDNCIVIDNTRMKILNDSPLRAQDEFVRHKALDAIGDLALAGAPIIGLYQAYKPGHQLTGHLVETLLKSPHHWEWQ